MPVRGMIFENANIYINYMKEKESTIFIDRSITSSSSSSASASAVSICGRKFVVLVGEYYSFHLSLSLINSNTIENIDLACLGKYQFLPSVVV